MIKRQIGVGDPEWGRVIVSGDRHWNCPDLAARYVDRLRKRFGNSLTIIHGAAPGVDRSFADAARVFGVTVESCPAKWRDFGDRAGPIRNAEMISRGACMVLACHRTMKSSRGTKDLCRKALRAGMPIWLIESELGEPRRIGLKALE